MKPTTPSRAMQSCSVHHCVLLLLTLTFTTAPVLSAVCSKTVKLHQPVTLSCEYKCSGSVKWSLFNNRDVVFAGCDETSCSSLVKGYNMSYDQYQDGDLSLTITAADYRMRNTYSCECGVSEISTVRLSIETVFSAVQVKHDGDLILDLTVPEPVEVIYTSSDSADGEWICNVTQHSLQCKAEYTHRTSLRYPELTLRDVTHSDSGRYTIRDTENKEDIRVYSVSVTDEKFPRWIIGLIVPVVVILLVTLLFLCIKYQKNAVHQEFIKVSKQLEHVNKLIQQARPGKEQGNKRHVGATEAVQKAEEAMKELERRYRESPKYSEQIKLFCKAKRAELMECSGEEGEGLLMTERGGIMGKMEEVMKSLQQLSGDGAGHLQGTSSDIISETEINLTDIEQWCSQKRAELNNFRQQHTAGAERIDTGHHASLCRSDITASPLCGAVRRPTEGVWESA
ncbi:uncharacterized protein LOC108255570 isoform X2 [Ictalurus punctatus]|uniref:Uncharacterized protein LOC108255570 isoform X2 n=1 Tax=Ictalurus punctatus TaxID=7998 RepID=A0A2D0PKG7_ICTPU|nr:uncharacterized protein LOC108255570 isoform X2 [Ictalurus punctatus]